jgi:hypothetical protein
VLLPRLSLEIRAAIDTTIQKELAALRGFIGTSLDSHSERLHGDIATLLPATRSPDLDLPTMIAERSWSKIAGWTLAVAASAGAAVMSWLWWSQGTEIVALRTDLAAAYAEVETLRALPAVVSPPPVAGPMPEAALAADPALTPGDPAVGTHAAIPAADTIGTVPADVAPIATSTAPVAAPVPTAAPVAAPVPVATAAPAAAESPAPAQAQ